MLDFLNLETFADTHVDLRCVVDAFDGARLVLWADDACCFAVWHGGLTVNLFSPGLDNFDCFTFSEVPEDVQEAQAHILATVREAFVDG